MTLTGFMALIIVLPLTIGIFGGEWLFKTKEKIKMKRFTTKVLKSAGVLMLLASAAFGQIGFTSGSAQYLQGGVAGAIPYQSATNTTGFSAAGTAGRALVSGGTGAPTWFTPTAGRVIYAGTDGVLADDANMTFDGIRLTVARITTGSIRTTGGANLDFFGIGEQNSLRTTAGAGAPLIIKTNNGEIEPIRFAPTGVGVRGISTPSAWMHIAAGTATAGTAPLKFTSGTNLTAAEDGAFEYDGTNLYFTTTSGPTRNTIAFSSTERVKKNIRPTKYDLQTVLGLRPVDFEWKKSGLTDFGLIAEEVARVDSGLVVIGEDGLPGSVKYQQMVSILIKAIQEQQKRIEALEAKLKK